MKKLIKSIITVACVGTLCAGIAAFAGCSNGVKGEAYGLVHGAGYVGYASVTVNGDKVTDATLSEVCFPDHVKTADDDYYATVTYGDVTMTYDADAETYKVGTQTIKEYFQSGENCKAYYDAVMSNSVTVKVGNENKTDIMTKAALSKDENGYWTRTKNEEGKWVTDVNAKDANAYSRWKMNRDATIKYVKEHGVENLLKLVKSDTATPDAKEDKDVKYWMDGTINTGATWNDLNSTKEGSFSYAQLIVNAYNAAKK